MRTIITDKAKLAALIATITRNGKKLDADIQTAAMAVALMAHEHGNVMPLNELFLALGKGARHSALTAWLLVTAPVVANVDKATNKEMPFIYEKTKRLTGDTLNLRLSESDSEGNQWFDMKPSPTPDEELDVYALVAALIKKASKDGVKLKAGSEAALDALKAIKVEA